VPATTNVLVDPPDLARELGSAQPPAVLDVRWSLQGPPGIELFRESHIPSAQFCDLDTDLAAPPPETGPKSRGRHPLPTAQGFVEAMQRLGIHEQDRVVVYDGADSSVAARGWWCFRFFGHRDVRVLNGGLQAWLRAGMDIETGDPPSVSRGDLSAQPGGMPVLDPDTAAEVASRGLLIDARAPARYRGETEPVDPVAGHIPGAVNAPTSTFVDDQGRLLEPDMMRRRFAALGDRPVPSIGAYCGSGVNAAQLVLAGAVADQPVSLYVGSWSEWVSDPTRPVQVGAEPG